MVTRFWTLLTCFFSRWVGFWKTHQLATPMSPKDIQAPTHPEVFLYDWTPKNVPIQTPEKPQEVWPDAKGILISLLPRTELTTMLPCCFWSKITDFGSSKSCPSAKPTQIVRMWFLVAEEYVKDLFVSTSLARTLHSMYGSHLLHLLF